MKKDGFTLIELLAVIVILGIVVGIAIPGINSVISNSRKKSVLAEAEILHSAALRKLASEPDFDFSIIDKDNVKQYMETDSKLYDKVQIVNNIDEIIVILRKYGFKVKTNGKKTTISTLPPHIAYEFNLSLGTGFVDIRPSELESQDIYVYQGTYNDNISDIEKGFKNPYMILTNLTPDTDLRTKLGNNGIYTVIATKMTRTSGNGYPSRDDWSRKQTSLIGIPNFDIKELGVTSLRYFFLRADYFNQNINDWDTSTVTDMHGTFMGARTFNQPLNNWDVGKVTTMYYMFWGAYKFNQPLNNWNMESTKTTGEMFHSAYKFNQDISSWNMSNVTAFNYMFYSALEFDSPLNQWNVSNVENFSGMFNLAKNFNQPLNNWDTSNALEMGRMFQEMNYFNQDLSSWDVHRILSKPDSFDYLTSSWTKPKPIWGTNGGN